jgi:hypothetical protein
MSINRRAFFAALLAPLAARLALAAAPERKLLGDLRIPHAGVPTEQLLGHLYLRAFGADNQERWLDLGPVKALNVDTRTNTLQVLYPLPPSTIIRGVHILLDY